MICFPCRCGHQFEEPDDAAGSPVQCPSCKLLNDVPLHGAERSIESDGTYVVEEREAPPAPKQIEKTIEVFASTRMVNPQATDLRTQAEDIDDIIGDVETADQARKRLRPRYDPETGELIGEIGLREEFVPKTDGPPIPFAKPVIAYAEDDTDPSRGFAKMLLDLVQPTNLLMLALVLFVHVFFLMTFLGLGMGLLTIIPVQVALLIAMLAHYGNVIDEVGVVEQDALPRFMRDLHFYEDIWWPFLRVLLTSIICYGVVGLVFLLPMPTASCWWMAVIPFLAGSYFFPAIILTLQTSGALANLRPDRLFAVMKRSFYRYPILVMMLLVGLPVYLFAMTSLAGTILGLTLFGPAFLTPMVNVPLAFALLCFGIFVMHAFCWELGLLYRHESENFGWIGRYHVRETPKRVVRRKPKYVTPVDSKPGVSQP